MMVRPSRWTAPISLSICLRCSSSFRVPARLVVEAVGLAVGRDVGVDQHDLAALHRRVALGDVGPAVAQATSPRCRSARCPASKRLLEEVVEPRAAVLGDQLARAWPPSDQPASAHGAGDLARRTARRTATMRQAHLLGAQAQAAPGRTWSAPARRRGTAPCAGGSAGPASRARRAKSPGRRRS